MTCVAEFALRAASSTIWHLGDIAGNPSRLSFAGLFLQLSQLHSRPEPFLAEFSLALLS
jgi:hypothetical protein